MSKAKAGSKVTRVSNYNVNQGAGYSVESK